MDPLVLDSSFTLAWCFLDEKSARTDGVRDSLIATHAIVPPLWKWEVSNGLLMGVRRKRISRDDALEAFARLAALPIRIDSAWSGVSSQSLFELAESHQLTIYDSAYLELAQRLKLPLATLDGPLASAAAKLGLRIL